jgi:FkbM family methyltransferase
MNTVERKIDDAWPDLGVRLRVVKMRWRRDVTGRLITALVRPGDVVVDIGANRGVYTALLSNRVGRRGRVHAVEPVPEMEDRLQRVARRKGNVSVHALALSDNVGTTSLQLPLFHGHAVDALASIGRTTTVPSVSVDVTVTTLDDLLRNEPGRISLVKCDVEGHEHHVLRGGLQLIREHHPALVVEIEQRHREDPISTTFAMLGELGYSAYSLTEAGPRDLSTFDLQRDQLAFLSDGFVPYGMPAGYVNDFLFLPPELEVPDGLTKERAVRMR